MKQALFMLADSTNCGTNTFFNWGCDSKDTAIMDVIINIFNWLSIGVGTVVIIFVIIGAIQYTSAAGNSDKAKKALDMIKNAVIALFLYLIMWALLNYLIPGGVF